LVKNLFLTTHRSVVRKGVEMTLTPLAELILSKRRILELYLNEIEWGPGVYGIEAAARHHYRVPATGLDRDQAARLAAVIPAPLQRRPDRMGNYARLILARMTSLGW
jgi:monofunctional biosynthetic peptidoglycan transglycosylase